jgi:hypothetical protein
MDIKKDDYGYWVAKETNYNTKSVMHFKHSMRSGTDTPPNFTEGIVVGLCDEVIELRQQVERLQEVKIEYEVRMKEMRKEPLYSVKEIV